ncbi:type II toxin-antitoxin system ChpB family toxin [Motilimonas eburnea]|uniref:type II toxin-antitoxin system ChpB family toxin n=1 Tax=Motilimonas eburnea TaxID=1737488 RepID=UPI001E4A78B8|nr:type II toxin-antitoxin system ChpB family toxin [Motilimonas eburnea]MCE2571854.1 type II toxin-antitoxin system ChpB family toxin [Motilimonas eburnea]
MAVYERGDIVRACLNPTAGNEMQGEMRPCLVISPKAFNRLGLTLIAPITQGGNYSRFKGFSITLMGAGTETQGVVLVNGIRSIDLNARKAKKVEAAPSEIVDEALAMLSAILD